MFEYKIKKNPKPVGTPKITSEINIEHSNRTLPLADGRWYIGSQKH